MTNNYSLPPAFYDHLIDWQLLEDILQLVNENERSQAQEIIIQVLDYAVIEVALEHLPTEHHQEFLQLCSIQHHHPSLLDWLEDKKTGIKQILKEALKENKNKIKKMLQKV